MKNAALKIPALLIGVPDSFVSVSLSGKVITLFPKGDTDVTTTSTDDRGYATAGIFRNNSRGVCPGGPTAVGSRSPRSRQSDRGRTPPVLSLFGQREKVGSLDDDHCAVRDQVLL